MASNSFVVGGGNVINLSSMFAVSAKAGSPTYLVLTGLDRDEYTAGATGATGTLNGNGHSTGFSSIGDDGRGADVVFTLQASTGRYYNSSYGYFDQMTYTASSSLNDVTNLSLFTTNDHNLATSYGNNAYAMDQLDPTGYLGSASIATQPHFSGVVPAQATPDSVIAAAQGFVGQAWNENGCWVLASSIAAEAGASLPVDSSMIGVSGHANGEWFVAFDGSKQSGNWQSLVKAGEIVVIGSASMGHITTVVSGSGSTAMLIDNITYVNASGAIVNSANDGSASDVTISAAHLASQEWSGVNASMVKIYELDAPVVTALVATDKLALHASQLLSQVFSAADPAGKALTQYQIYDTATSDSLLVNGATVAAHTAAAAATVTSLAAVSLQTGTSAVSDMVEVRAFNGTYWGDWQSLGVTTGAAAAAPAPVVPVAPKVLAPTLAHQTANQGWADGAKIALTLPANTFSDPQGQHLSYSAYQVGGTSVTSWLSFNAATDTFSGLVPKTASGLVTLEVLATNSSGLSTTDVFTVGLGAAAVSLVGQAPVVHGAELIHFA